MKNIIIYLLIIVASLILIDIVTGLWFFNRPALEFDSTKFNNIATPIATILASVAVIVALSYSRKQNKISISSSIKPFIERKIDLLIDEMKNQKLNDGISNRLFPNETINALNFPDYIEKAFMMLTKDQDYNEDVENFEKTNDGKNIEYYKTRSYYKELVFITDYALSRTLSLTIKTRNLLSDIELQLLIIEDKKLLIERIKTELLYNYIGHIKSERRLRLIHPKIPFLYDIPNPIVYKHLFETDYAELYNWMNEKKLLQNV